MIPVSFSPILLGNVLKQVLSHKNNRSLKHLKRTEIEQKHHLVHFLQQNSQSPMLVMLMLFCSNCQQKDNQYGYMGNRLGFRRGIFYFCIDRFQETNLKIRKFDYQLKRMQGYKSTFISFNRNLNISCFCLLLILFHFSILKLINFIPKIFLAKKIFLCKIQG